VLGTFQATEPAAIVRQGCSLVPGGDRDPAYEHSVRAAGDCLLDTTLEVGQRSAQHGHAVQALVAGNIRELVAFLGELVGKVLLPFRQDVDAERP
jgi:hypothetical protein